MSTESDSESDEIFDLHPRCEEFRCHDCMCKFCGIRCNECKCPYAYNGSLFKKTCRGCSQEFELGNLQNGYLIRKTHLGDVDEEYTTRYRALCTKCCDEADSKYKEYQKKGKLYDKLRATSKKEIARLKEENTRQAKELTELREAMTKQSSDTTNSFTNPTDDKIMFMELITVNKAVLTTYNDNTTKLMEIYKSLPRSSVYHNEDTPSPDGELKRMRTEEIEVVDNASTAPVNTHNEIKTMACNSCKSTKPLSMFQTKSREKIKGGKIAEYLITRKKCKSCRNKEYNRAKKARLSPGDNICTTEKEPEDGIMHQ